KVNDVVTMIGSALQAFTGLADFKSIAPEALDALGAGILLATNMMIKISGQVDPAMLKAAGRFAMGVTSVVAAIQNALQAFTALQDFKQVTQAILDQVFAGMSSMIRGIVDLANNTDATALSAAQRFSQKAQAVFDAIKGAVEALSALGAYKGI